MSRASFAIARAPHINGLEGFWGYLKRRWAGKGSIRGGGLPLYMAEYVSHYNHRRLSVDDRVEHLLRLLQTHRQPGGYNASLPLPKDIEENPEPDLEGVVPNLSAFRPLPARAPLQTKSH